MRLPAINTYNLFKLGARIAPFFPVWLGNALCDLVGLAIFWLVPSRRKAVLCNLSHVLSDRTLAERRKIARSIFKGNIRNYYDLFRVHAVPAPERLRLVERRGFEYVYEAFKRGKGIIAIAAHQGSFSFACQIATDVNFDFYLTVEPIEPPELFELVRELREQDPRTHTIAVGHGGEVRNIFRALKENHMVCLAIDRDVIGNGKPQKFFGADAILPTGAAEIALRTGASVLPVKSCRKADGSYILQFLPGFVAEPTGDKAADVERVSAQMIREIERMLRDDPKDWVVLQPIWPDCA